jgi:hypothetical protein
MEANDGGVHELVDGLAYPKCRYFRVAVDGRRAQERDVKTRGLIPVSFWISHRACIATFL